MGFDPSDNMFAPTSEEVANTVNSYNLMFCNEYAINRAASAGSSIQMQEGMRSREENGILSVQGGEGMRYREGQEAAVQATSSLPGVLYGRYGGDTYAGGNPWVLSTAALAGLFYRGAKYVLDHGVPSASALKVSIWLLCILIRTFTLACAHAHLRNVISHFTPPPPFPYLLRCGRRPSTPPPPCPPPHLRWPRSSQPRETELCCALDNTSRPRTGIWTSRSTATLARR
ncbi:hypothetical protein EON63_23660 [archaeon]|nr:MAG: hypothetical protein EON63_23660 [archaeon]